MIFCFAPGFPVSCTPDAFYATLVRELTPAGVRMCDPFKVKHIVRHWAFASDEGTPPEQPHTFDLDNLQAEEISAVEAGLGSAPAELRERLIEQNLICIFNDRNKVGAVSPGVKFAVAVAGDPELPASEIVTFERQVTRILDEAVNIDERSLYTGSGFGHFLILGRVGYENFHAIQSEIVAQLNTAAIREKYESRTMTHVSGQRGFSIAIEGLAMTLTQVDKVVNNGAALGEVQLLDLHDLNEGDEFSRFVIKGRVDEDRGGFAYVYRAYDKLEDIDRALKVFKSPGAQAVEREMDALRKIKHKNVVRFHWGEKYGPFWFIVTDFIEGRSFAGLGQIDPDDALRKVIQVLEALEAIHGETEALATLKAKDTHTEDEYQELQQARENAIVHRDIKPDNIMVDRNGAVKLLDFNIASRVADPMLTQSGTPEYMLPDPILGRWTPAHDIFACGVVLYELICGELPYPHKPATHLRPIDPRIRHPELQASLAELLMRICAPMAGQLHPTAWAMRADLEGELSVTGAGRTMQTLRNVAGITIEDLAERSGVDAEKIGRVERGEEQIGFDETMKVLGELGDLLNNGPENASSA